MGKVRVRVRVRVKVKVRGRVACEALGRDNGSESLKSRKAPVSYG